jgi:hypothetical protein
MIKKGLIIICFWSLVECFTGGWSNNQSLTFSNPNERILAITLYLLPNCPHASEVLPRIETWIQFQDNRNWQTLPPTPFYPSPTLRIVYQEYGVNYIGKNEILELISK